ncbi:MAG: hypothetical protein U9Q94_00795 [Candidatus Bipolaricaulota bacterium]|nr:hypothetical protein [Candidatus Bipolaricaulota bacterium]
MKQIAIVTATLAVIFLLAGILVVLIHVGRTGITVNVTGRVGLENATDGIDLTMPTPVNLVATGPENQPVSTDLSLFRCPKCGGTMLPVRFNMLTGQITWKCPECSYTITGDEEVSP